MLQGWIVVAIALAYIGLLFLVASYGDRKRGLTYAIDVSIGNGTLKTKGCMLAHLLCKSVGWTRTN